MTLKKLIPISIATLLVTGCSGIPTNTDYSLNKAFTNWQSYSCCKIEESSSKNPLISAVTHSRIEEAIETQLDARYKKLDSANANFTVSYSIAKVDRPDSSSGSFIYSLGYGYHHQSIFVSDRAPRDNDKTLLIIDLTDSQDAKKVWRGTTEIGNTLTSNISTEKRKLKLTEAVNRILEKFPPGTM